MTPFIVAEMSANHLGDFARAMRIVDAAADAGADAIKLQTWTPGTMCVSDYRLDRGPWKCWKLRDLYEAAHTPWEWHHAIFSLARRRGIVPFSAAFDRESVDFLETLGVDRHKVASFELTDLPLIRYMASKGKPMILSTGMASLDEVDDAILATGNVDDITLLLCTSAYPADASDANLAGLELIDHPGGFKPGISDHSLGIGVAVAAVGVAAAFSHQTLYIEKHLTLSRADGGPDAGFSMEPAEFAQMVTECRRAAAAIGVPSYGPGPNESTALRRSLWVTKDVAAGEPLVFGVNFATARPALGAPPDMAERFEGWRPFEPLQAGTPLPADMAKWKQ